MFASRELCRQHASYAAKFLRCIVSSFCELYGENASHNVQCLIHLASDVQMHGELDSLSYFQRLRKEYAGFKRQLRNHGKPLEQLRNRMVESQTQSYRQGEC